MTFFCHWLGLNPRHRSWALWAHSAPPVLTSVTRWPGMLEGGLRALQSWHVKVSWNVDGEAGKYEWEGGRRSNPHPKLELAASWYMGSAGMGSGGDATQLSQRLPTAAPFESNGHTGSVL